MQSPVCVVCANTIDLGVQYVAGSVHLTATGAVMHHAVHAMPPICMSGSCMSYVIAFILIHTHTHTHTHTQLGNLQELYSTTLNLPTMRISAFTKGWRIRF